MPLELILTIGSAISGFIMKSSAQRMANQQKLLEMSIKRDQVNSTLADAAAKRSSPWLRKFVAVFVISVCFGGLLIAALSSIPVSIIQEIPQKSLLFGLIQWGKTFEVVTVGGLFFPDWARYCVLTIAGFLFGTGASKTS